MKNRFGKLLRKLRIEAGRSIGEVARHLDVSTVYVSDVERGVRAPFTAERILQTAQFLGVKAGQLLIAAALQKKVFEFDVSGATPAELHALSGMARGGVTERQWEEILEILGGEDDADEQ
jgi:transcriptional regulator with XRE-family HTH domain